MDAITKMARAYMQKIPTKSQLLEFIDSLTFTEKERTVVMGFYYEQKSMEVIASEMGYSVQSIRLYHRNALMKVNDYIMGTQMVQYRY